MQKWSKTLMAGVIAGSLLLGSLPALAQSTYDPKIDAREQRQQERIQQGVQSGQLTSREANHLEAQQGRIQAREDRMKANGNLTPRGAGQIDPAAEPRQPQHLPQKAQRTDRRFSVRSAAPQSTNQGASAPAFLCRTAALGGSLNLVGRPSPAASSSGGPAPAWAAPAKAGNYQKLIIK